MRPAAASRIILPVGVGLISRGPTGAAGLTITAGTPSSAPNRNTAIDDPLHTGGGGGAQHGHAAIDIRAQHGGGVGHPDAVIGRDMKHMAATGDGAGEGGGVRQIPGHTFHIQPGEVTRIATCARHHTHAVATRQQRPRHRGADKAGRACHQAWANPGQSRRTCRSKVHSGRCIARTAPIGVEPANAAGSPR